MKTLDELIIEEEDRALAEANTPARIAADRELRLRSDAKSAREIAALTRQGMIDDGSADDEEEDED